MSCIAIVIVGATGSGKSHLVLELASAFNGEIINSDSLQLYRGFDIGTAKTPISQRRNIPHHLLDVLEPSAGYSAGEYGREARRLILDIAARGRLPMVVGGTGFYLKALFEGLPILPGKDEQVRHNLATRENRHPGRLHRLLRRLEPSAALRIHANDTQKLIRALEIRILTGAAAPAPKSVESFQHVRAIFLGLDPDRAALVERLRHRTNAMFTGGLLEEVKGLLTQGATGGEKPFESLGYKQALQHLQGLITLEAAIESTFVETRQYAKRQRTWFRRQTNVNWLRGFGDDAAIGEQAADILRVQNSTINDSGISSATG